MYTAGVAINAITTKYLSNDKQRKTEKNCGQIPYHWTQKAYGLKYGNIEWNFKCLNFWYASNTIQGKIIDIFSSP